MSVMLEVWLSSPPDDLRLNAMEECIARRGGRTTYREANTQATCFTIEFDGWDVAKSAGQELRDLVDHLEGPVEYGDD